MSSEWGMDDNGAPDRAAESAHELKKSRPLTERIHTSKCCTNCCTKPYQNAQKRPGIRRNHLYFTTTYTKLSHFVIDRSSVQVRSSAPVFSIACRQSVHRLLH